MSLIDPKVMRTYAIVSSAVFTKAVLIGIGYYVGSILDKKFGTAPLFILVCITLGLALGLWWLIRSLNRRNNDDPGPQN